MNKPVTWLTGAASGIGWQLANLLHAEGHTLICTDLNEAGLLNLREALGDSENLLTLPQDVSRYEDWQRILAEVLARFGRLDTLLNVAGYLLPGEVHRMGQAGIDRHIDVNAKGLMYGSQVVAAHMAEAGRGHIVNIASLAGITPVGGLTLYSASKFAVRGFSLSLAQEMRPYGVRVSVVCPDAVQTPMLDLQLDYPEAALAFSGKALQATQIARLIVYKVLPGQRWEYFLPWHRGLTAKLVGLAPGLARWLAAPLQRKGLRVQAKLKQSRRE